MIQTWVVCGVFVLPLFAPTHVILFPFLQRRALSRGSTFSPLTAVILSYEWQINALQNIIELAFAMFLNSKKIRKDFIQFCHLFVFTLVWCFSCFLYLPPVWRVSSSVTRLHGPSWADSAQNPASRKPSVSLWMRVTSASANDFDKVFYLIQNIKSLNSRSCEHTPLQGSRWCKLSCAQMIPRFLSSIFASEDLKSLPKLLNISWAPEKPQSINQSITVFW